MGALSLLKKERLRKRSDFTKLSKDGRRFHSEYFVVVCSRNGLGRSRLGVTISKRVGRAVARNRIKRLVREHFRHRKAVLKDNYDLNVIAKGGSSALLSQEMREALDAVVHDMLRKCEDEAVSAGTH